MKNRPLAQPLHISVAVTLIELGVAVITNRGFLFAMVMASPVIIIGASI